MPPSERPSLAKSAGRIVLENAGLRLEFSSDGCARSLRHKLTGQELLASGVRLPAFSLTQLRPYNPQLQVSLPAKSTTFPAVSLRRQGDRLYVDFGPVDYEAEIRVRTTDHYLAFTLEKVVYHNRFTFRAYQPPMVDEVTFLQLPLRPRKNFGDWLNVLWDRRLAVNLLATDPYARIAGDLNGNHYVFSASAAREVRLEGVGAALLACPTERLLDGIAKIEHDFGLPPGAKGRRRPEAAWSYYEILELEPKDIDRHIEYARRGGFRLIQLYYLAFAETVGHFDFRPAYPNGIADVKRITDRIKAAGIIPGIHVHYNKATKTDRYVVGKPDPRLNAVCTLTLKEAIGAGDTTITVDEEPLMVPTDEGQRLLRIDDELIEWERRTNEPPYRFLGCKRGHLKTRAAAHRAGVKVAALDVDTWPEFVRFDQRTSIQQEVSDRLAKIYHEGGFSFIYFDGAEDVHPPYWFNVSWPQWVTYRGLDPEPVVTSGACKSHFSWHLTTRGCGLDTMEPEQMKSGTRHALLKAAERAARDFTSADFGWIGYWTPSDQTIGTQPDMLEYAASRAASWNGTATFFGELPALNAHPRTADNLEILRRWEEVRVNDALTPRQKRELRDGSREHHLLLNERGEFELVEVSMIDGAAGGSRDVRAFVFLRKRRLHVLYWHATGAGTLAVRLRGGQIKLMEPFGTERPVENGAGRILLPLDRQRYLEVRDVTKVDLIAAIRRARLVPQPTPYHDGKGRAPGPRNITGC